MIQVFLESICPHCGQPMIASKAVLDAMRNVPQYQDRYDDSIYFYIDPIKDNAESALLVELCREHDLDYHVWDDNEVWDSSFAQDFIEEFVPLPEVEVAMLDFLTHCMLKALLKRGEQLGLGDYRHEVLS